MDPEVTILFDRKGDFLGVEQSEEVPAMGLLEVLPLSSALQTQVRQTVGAALDAMARKRWEQRVGRWRGITLMPGEMVLRETRMRVGQSSMQREEVKAEVSTFLMEGVPCMSDMQERNCVRLFVETVPARSYRESDPCARARALERFELVTDPDTLLPYMARTVRKDEMDSCEKDGTVSTREVFQMEEFVFAYGKEPTATGTHLP